MASRWSAILSSQRHTVTLGAAVALVGAAGAALVWVGLLFLTRRVDAATALAETAEYKPDAETGQTVGYLTYWAAKLFAASVQAKHKFLFGSMIDSCLLSTFAIGLDLVIFMLVRMRFWCLVVGVFLPTFLVEPTWHVVVVDGEIKTWRKYLMILAAFYKMHAAFFGVSFLGLFLQLLIFTIANYGTRSALLADDSSILTPIGTPLALFLALGYLFTLFKSHSDTKGSAPIMKYLHKQLFQLMPQWKRMAAKTRAEEIANNVSSMIFDSSQEASWGLISKLCIYRSYPKSFYLCSVASVGLTLAERAYYAYRLRRAKRKAAAICHPEKLSKVDINDCGESNRDGLYPDIAKPAANISAVSVQVNDADHGQKADVIRQKMLGSNTKLRESNTGTVDGEMKAKELLPEDAFAVTHASKARRPVLPLNDSAETGAGASNPISPAQEVMRPAISFSSEDADHSAATLAALTLQVEPEHPLPPHEPPSPFSPIPAAEQAALIRLGLITSDWATRLLATLLSVLWLTTPPMRTWTSCTVPAIGWPDMIARVASSLILGAAQEAAAGLIEHSLGQADYARALGREEWGAFGSSGRVVFYVAMYTVSVVGVMVLADAGPFLVGQMADPACYQLERL
ncbi:hypothetical protein HK101_011305 [Irineochytrium annulatum]|nr:hypothetical protein HK101_011305 [Irineochytrium annulatum]